MPNRRNKKLRRARQQARDLPWMRLAARLRGLPTVELKPIPQQLVYTGPALVFNKEILAASVEAARRIVEACEQIPFHLSGFVVIPRGAPVIDIKAEVTAAEAVAFRLLEGQPIKVLSKGGKL